MASTLSFYLLILLSSLSLASSQYVLPQRYFINCGSNSYIDFTSDIDFTNRNFVGDVNPSTFSLSGDHVAAENNNPATDTPPIYRTARVFTKKSWYNLEADTNNTFVMIHLHFSRFGSDEFEFSNSKLDVSVSGFPLLTGFSIGNATVIREFIFPIHSERKFRIEFTPTAGAAFVNAIEAFTTPADLFTASVAFPRISPAGVSGNLEKLTEDYAFNPIHRVNIGGESISATRDTLRRTWTGDEPFIFNNGPARNFTLGSGGRIDYKEGGASEFDAPEDVYRTAKLLNNNLVNITWTFDVKKETVYLVRAHFCDINRTSLGSPNDAFNFFVYSHRVQIPPDSRVWELYVPFYLDSVVESADSSRLNVSIGAIRGNNMIAFLNGVEIMELLKNSGVSDSKKKGNSVGIVVGCVVGGVVFVIVLLLAGFFIGKRCGKQKPKPVVAGGKSVSSDGRSLYTSINVELTVNHASTKLDLNLKVPFVDIVEATDNFDENLVIGRGGFGKVYKGTLHGKKVAIKQGQHGQSQGWTEFVNEIMVLSKIRFKDLVCLIGYCDENSEMILVYEFMENGTLQDHLYGKDNPKLTWVQRLKMCISAACGLNYLHTGAEVEIIHRDVKSTNILLNEHYDAKVSDFGISRLDSGDNVSDMSYVKGSFGYLDPEYVRCNKLTTKSDVYSFGVVLLEVLCARPALDTKPDVHVNLAEWAVKHIENENVKTIIDPVLVDTIRPDSLRNFVVLVEQCLKETGDERPTMKDVWWDLVYVLELQQMSVDRELYDDTTINMSLQLPMSINERLPSPFNDDSFMTDNSVMSYSTESQVFSQLKMDEAR